MRLYVYQKKVAGSTYLPVTDDSTATPINVPHYTSTGDLKMNHNQGIDTSEGKQSRNCWLFNGTKAIRLPQSSYAGPCSQSVYGTCSTVYLIKYPWLELNVQIVEERNTQNQSRIEMGIEG